MKNFNFKTIALALALCFTQIAIAAEKTNAAKSTVETAKETFCGVSDQEITFYLAQYGYEVKGMYQMTGSCDVYVKTQYSYITVVVIVDGEITDHHDIQI